MNLVNFKKKKKDYFKYSVKMSGLNICFKPNYNK